MNYITLIFVMCFFNAYMSYELDDRYPDNTVYLNGVNPDDFRDLNQRLQREIRKPDQDLLNLGKKVVAEIEELEKKSKTGPLKDSSELLTQLSTMTKGLVDQLENNLQDGHGLPDFMGGIKEPGVMDADSYQKQFEAVRSLIADLKQRNLH